MAVIEQGVQAITRPSRWHRAWRGLATLFASKTAVIGLIIVLFWILAPILAPLLTPYSPTAQDYKAQNAAPSAAHILGTDDLGRDIWSRLLYGARVVLVTDSGMPGVSDPGARIVAACREAALPVTVLPGPSAVTAAIALCGFESAGFRFAGFLPHKPGARRRMLEGIAESPEPVAFFESPFRFLRLLAEMREILPDRRIFVARELTKLFEECRTGTPDEVEAAYAGRAIKGELVIVVAPAARPPREGGREAEAAERPEGRTRNDADEHG